MNKEIKILKNNISKVTKGCENNVFDDRRANKIDSDKMLKLIRNKYYETVLFQGADLKLAGEDISYSEILGSTW